MKDFSIELASENINDQRSKEYFHEVLSSFINGNYRSATVMLWSVVIADFVYKLQALRDLYQDQIALSILTAIEAKQHANPNSPEWEPFLLEEIYKRTYFLEAEEYSHLKSLHQLRHLSAHPVLNGGYKLFSPNKETVRALIRNAMEATLLKHPIFSKKIVSEFILDIAAKKELLPGQKDLKLYLEAKYFGSLHASVEQELIKALWKFCFRLSNQDADSHRGINTRALTLLHDRSPINFRKYLTAEVAYFSEISEESVQLETLILFLSDCPHLFNALDNSAKIPLHTYAHNDVKLLAQASYLSDDFLTHIAKLKGYPYLQLKALDEKGWKYLLTKGSELNLIQEVYGIGIKIYCESGTFNSADLHFEKYIEPYVANFDQQILIQLLQGIEPNNQTYWRGRAKIDHSLIAERINAVEGIDTTAFPNFVESLGLEQ